ncbi:MAG: amidohydrolase family protein [Firmicutes bacterium]|nr:amidohydrolase family protein [Bacillota bacterium]
MEAGMPSEVALVPERVLVGGELTPERGVGVWVAGEWIREVVPVADLPSHLPRWELPGATLMPGLIDAHVHLDLPGDGSTFAILSEGDETLAVLAAANARTALEAGVTTVRDCGSRGQSVYAVRRAAGMGWGELPDVVAAGAPLTITGGHTWPMGGEADGPEGCRLAVRRRVRDGCDFVKVIHSGGGTPNTAPWRPSFRPEELRAIVDEAHRLGRRVTVHCLCADAIRQAVEAGADQIEHGYFYVAPDRQEVDRDTIDLLARTGVAVTPTLSVAECQVQAEPGDVRWRHNAEAGRRMAAAMVEAGVRLVAGTDAGWRYVGFDAVRGEIELLAQAGMGSRGALAAATCASASALGLKDRGRIAPGMRADLLAVDGDPLGDLAHLRRVRLVLRAGRPVPQGGQASSGGDSGKQ